MRLKHIICLTGFFLLCFTFSGRGQTIVKAEYFFNADPGFGKGKNLPVTASGQVNVEAELSTEGLQKGFHTLFVRFRDQQGSWSMNEGRVLFIDKTNSTAATIIAAEYYFDDTNPAPGKGTPLVIEPGPSIEFENQIEIIGLTEGIHRLNVRFLDSKGVWGYTVSKEFTVATPRIDTIIPASGGNIGDVTVNIIGASFDEGTKLKLTRNGHADIIVPDSVMSIIKGEQIQAMFDLRGKAVGEYNVVVTLGDGTSLSFPNGFSVIEGVRAEPWAEILGFDRIRRGQWQTYTVTYGNKGNVDATGVPLWIQIPVEGEYKLDFELYKPETNAIAWDTVSNSVLTDTIHGNPEAARLIPLIIPTIAPNEVGTLTFKLKTDATDTINISAWVSKPMYQSPLNNNVIDCYADMAVAVANVIPGVGCLYSIMDLGLRPLFKQIKTGDNGLNDSNGKFKAGSFTASVSFAAAGCIPGGALIGNVGKIVGGMAKVGTIKSGSDAVTSCIDPFLPKEPRKKKPVRPVASFDPNDKLGLQGVGDKNYLTGTEIFPYLIRFENKASASAAAQTVIIVDTLDINTLDISTLQLGFFSFDDVIVNVPPGRKNYKADVDLRPKNDLIVRIEAKLDEEKGILTWLYTSLDPKTLKPSENPDAGFLPPNKTAPQGEGGVFFTIKPKSELATNIIIKNKAYIYFDNNDVIPTPTWSNAIDKMPPVSKVKDLAQHQSDTTFIVDWGGTDSGSGIASYSIYVAVNDQPYKLWLKNVAETSAMFDGKMDSTYQFYSIAKDSIGIAEIPPVVADASTTISKIIDKEDAIEKQVIVYPNPAHHVLRVELPEILKGSKLTLINIYGSNIMKMDVKDTIFSIPINEYAKGIYFLRVQVEDIVVIKKVFFN